MNWIAITISGILVIAFVVFAIIRNQKDKKEFENKLNNDYPKQKHEEGDAEIEA
jgi:preprotein translocase subunit YajC